MKDQNYVEKALLKKKEKTSIGEHKALEKPSRNFLESEMNTKYDFNKHLWLHQAQFFLFFFVTP